jgi:sirohydrochlorin cobaltochelatase
VVPGQEFTHKVLPLADEAPGLAVGTPLLTEDSDIERTIDALAAAHPTISDPSVANVVVAHGNERHPEFAERILALATRIHGRYPNVFVASVEGEPGTAPLEEARVWAQQSGHVHFVPLMVVAGDHVLNDVMGDEEDSWKQVVAAPKVTCGQPLGYLSAICDVFFDHLDDAIRRLAGRDAAR